MTSTDYWKRRAEEQILEAERRSSEQNKRLARFYADTTTRLQRDLDAFYARYAAETQMTVAEAQRVLNPAERQRFDRASAFYLAETKRLGFGKEHAAYLRRLSGQAYVSRQQALLAQTRQEVSGLFLNEHKILTGTLQSVYPDAFARAMKDLGEGIGLSGDFARMDTETVNRLLRQGWVGANYSSRIWTRKELLLSTLEEMIPRAFATGENSRVLGQQLADKLGVSRGAGERLVRTEVNYAANQSARLAYQQLGVDRYEYLATLDRRTSEICAALDGEVFWVEDASPGGNYPPMHPNCRSTTILYFPPDEFDGEYRRAARDKNGGYYTVSAKMKYPEWKATPESGMMEKTSIVAVAITDAVIRTLRTPILPDRSEQWNAKLNERHKELLRLAQEQPVGVEVAAYMDDALNGVVATVGTQSQVKIALDQGTVHMHNHPSGTTFTLQDVDHLLFSENIRILSAVGNNGRIFLLVKTDQFNFSGIYAAYQDAAIRQPNYERSPDEYIAFMEQFLPKLRRHGLIYLKGR